MIEGTPTTISSAEFSRNVERYISEANTQHKVFEVVAGSNDKSVVVLSKEEYQTWRAMTFSAASDYDEDGDMVSFTKERTGVDNTIFVSTKGHAQHAARIKIAIDPPDSFNAASTSASMTIHDCRVIGEPIPTEVAEQARKFIERNRDALIDYWEAKIGTEQLIARLRPPA